MPVLIRTQTSGLNRGGLLIADEIAAGYLSPLSHLFPVLLQTVSRVDDDRNRKVTAAMRS
jgi:hypothetical protein